MYLNCICIMFTLMDELIDQYEGYKVGATSLALTCMHLIVARSSRV